MTIDEYKEKYSGDDATAPGWQAIDEQLKKVYPDQEPTHLAPPIHYMLGGEDPLDGISIYNSEKQEKHFHYVSYGFSELYYQEEAFGKDYSKWGFELSFRVKKETDDDNFYWAANLMQNLAKYVFKSGKWFEEYHFIPANGPIRADAQTDITALAFIRDPELGYIKTPHGNVEFLQMVGLTTSEYDTLLKNPLTTETKKLLEKLQEKNPLLITDLARK